MTLREAMRAQDDLLEQMRDSDDDDVHELAGLLSEVLDVFRDGVEGDEEDTE